MEIKIDPILKTSTVNVFDVAEYILNKLVSISAMKLQKLVYYSQAWSLVWDDEPLYPESIEAWANGPVIPALYARHKGKFKALEGDFHGDFSKLNGIQKETIDAVLEFYGDKSSQWLSDLTHMEAPWQEARKGLKPLERGKNIISLASMAEYYNSINTESAEIE
jgi:uncharacterized phage-associated protein